MPDTPRNFNTYDATLTGAVNGSNLVYTMPEAPQTAMLFRNGVLMTQPLDGVVSGNAAVMARAQVPRNGDLVSVDAWVSGALPLNAGIQFSTVDGGVTGTMDRYNNVFTIEYAGLITQVMFFWNGDLRTPGLDYTISGNVITMLGGFPMPRDGDILTAEVWES